MPEAGSNSATPKNGILKTPGRKRTESQSNKIQDPVEVYCRVRPLGENDEESCVELVNDTDINLNLPKSINVASKVEQVKCTFTKVFDELTSQEAIFESVGLPLVEDLLKAKNGLCFMYGITSSGKTHTMNGSPSDSGVLPRCLDVLFNSIGHLQTKPCTFKSDGYNSYDVLSEEDAATEHERKLKEMEVKGRAGKTKSQPEIGDMMRTPDSTTLEVDEDNNYAVFISFVEIYNNSVFDLLDETPIDPINNNKPPPSKILREDRQKNMFVYETTEVEVKSTEEAYEVFWRGQNKRRTAHTLLNTESSRSHSVFNIKLVQAPLNPDGDSVLRDTNLMGTSQLSLCDLAGSERSKRTNVTSGDRMREAGNINNSLMTLRTCIESLRDNQKSQLTGSPTRMVPYRDSKLTHLFRNFFEGDGKVRMIVCLNPRAEDYDESLHVMKFSEMTQDVKVARAEGVKFNLGLTPGRGKASKLFKQTFKGMDDALSSDMTSEEEMIAPLQQFPAWPYMELQNPADSTCLVKLMAHLSERMNLRKILYDEWFRKQETVRAMIVQLDQDNIDLTKAMEGQRQSLTDKDKEYRILEKRVKSLNERIETLTRSTQSFEMQRRTLEAKLDEQKELYQKEKQERNRLKQTLKDLTSTERMRWEKECDKRVRDMQMEMEGAMLEKSEKLRQLKHVIQGLDTPERDSIISHTKVLTDRTNIVGSSSSGNLPIKVDIHINDEKPKETKTVHSGRTTTTTSKFTSRQKNVSKTPAGTSAKPPSRLRTKTTGAAPKTQVRSRSPPPTLNKPAPVRSSKHRRSRSSDYWLNHKPQDTLSTDTVMQPCLSKKKTVNTPKVKDLKATPNYMLTHQEQDSFGEIQTKLIKGEVMETRGGGTSVQFTDIETLKKRLESSSKGTPSGTPAIEQKTTKETPKTHNSKGKKRSSSQTVEDEATNSEDSWTDVETRCAVAIEGKPNAEPALTHHAMSKRPRTDV